VNAKLLAESKQGFKQLYTAYETSHPEIVNLLCKHGAKTSEELKA
jgi:hypothetical protein